LILWHYGFAPMETAEARWLISGPVTVPSESVKKSGVGRFEGSLERCL